MNNLLTRLFLVVLRTVPPVPPDTTFGDGVRSTTGSLKEALSWIPVLNLADFTGFKGFITALVLLFLFFAFIMAVVNLSLGFAKVAKAGSNPEKKKAAWDSVNGAGRLALVILGLPLIFALVVIVLSFVATRS